MDNIIFVDFKKKERVTSKMCPHLMGLLMTIHNCCELIGRDFVRQQLANYLMIKE